MKTTRVATAGTSYIIELLRETDIKIVFFPALFPHGCLISFPNSDFWIAYVVLLFHETCKLRSRICPHYPLILTNITLVLLTLVLVKAFIYSEKT